MLRMLDLFAGMGGASAAMVKHGWYVERIENDPALTATPVDVRDYRGIAGTFDLVWASPPCSEFAREAMPWCRTGVAPSLDMLFESQRIIGEVKPRFWVIENVQGAAPWFDTLLGPHIKCGACYLWGKMPRGIPWPKLNARKSHRSSRHRKQRAMVPYGISAALEWAIRFNS